jgi:hypothetical protein
MDSYRGFGVTMVEDDNIEIQDENGQPVIAKGYYCQIYADFDCNMEIDSFLLTEGVNIPSQSYDEAEKAICHLIDNGYEMYSEAKYKAIGTSTLYTVIENGHAAYFRTSIAGGFSYPFSIYNAAQNMADALNESNPMGTVYASEMFQLMRVSWNLPESKQEQRVFVSLSEFAASSHFEEFRNNAYTPYSITLNYDTQEIGFEFNKNMPEIGLPNIVIQLDSGEYENHIQNIPYEQRCDFQTNENAHRKAVTEIAEMRLFQERCVMTATLHSDTASAEIELPINMATAEELRRRLNVDSLDDCRVSDISSHTEYLNDISELRDIRLTPLNEIAGWASNELKYGDMYYLKVFAAAMEVDDIETIDDALSVAMNIHCYDCIEVDTAGEYGHFVLYECCREDIHQNFAAEVEDFIDYDAYGERRIEQDGAVLTSRGYVFRNQNSASKQQPNMSL